MSIIQVKTHYGLLVGRQLDKAVQFLGIRYALPPIGELRFMPPVPYRPGPDEIIKTLDPGLAPAQPVRPAPPWGGYESPPTGEDCLNLSIFTPGVDEARRPVLVHVFGGGFEGGSGSGGPQDGAALAVNGDCVVVRLNFRVGALGFLYLGDAWGEPYTAGNLGLLDVCVALEWVQENIQFLGGDPANVTLFGLSSGAFMLASLFGVPRSRGLFHRAWLQSGSASRILDRGVATGQATEFLDLLKIKAGDVEALLQVEVAQILEAQNRIVAQDVGQRNAPGGRTLGVVNEGHTLAEHPLQVIQRGDRRDIPILLGTTRDETRMWFAMGLMRQSSAEDVRQEFARYAGPDKGPQLLEVYRRLLPEAGPDQLREKFLTDAIYRIPAVRTALSHNAAGGRAFVYRFDWESPFMGGSIGAFHGLDEAFVWGALNPNLNGLVDDRPETQSVSRTMQAALYRFAATGDPGWPSYRDSEPVSRIFGGSGGGDTVAEVDSEFLAAWDGVVRN